MADIKQAAIWIQEGKIVFRATTPRATTFGRWADGVKSGPEGTLVGANGAPCILFVDSLLADDWEWLGAEEEWEVARMYAKDGK